MKLSEAIRLGAMIRAQCFGGSFLRAGSCAEGAACEASGLLYEDGLDDAIAIRHMRHVFTAYDVVISRPCPACGIGQTFHTAGLIAHLNDWHRWSRERIADFVATIEPQDEPATVEQSALMEVGK